MVVVVGEVSASVHVVTAVSHGIVLDPLMFLLFINDIVYDIDSIIKV